MKKLEIGDIVIIERSFLGQPVGSIGVVYELYDDFDYPAEKGASIILQNGINLGGFSREEQHAHLKFVCSTDFNYEFKNVMKLTDDYNKGVFKEVFNVDLNSLFEE